MYVSSWSYKRKGKNTITNFEQSRSYPILRDLYQSTFERMKQVISKLYAILDPTWDQIFSSQIPAIKLGRFLKTKNRLLISRKDCRLFVTIWVLSKNIFPHKHTKSKCYIYIKIKPVPQQRRARVVAIAGLVHTYADWWTYKRLMHF